MVDIDAAVEMIVAIRFGLDNPRSTADAMLDKNH
jgi:hypothetical protein